jgi:hypothetical protein
MFSRMDALRTLVFCCFVQAFDSSAQTCVWANRMGDSGGDQAQDVCVDIPNARVLTCGGYTGSIDLDPGPGQTLLTGSGGFLASYTLDGALEWAITHCPTVQGDAHDVEVDQEGNAYVTGYFYTAVDFDPGPGTAILPGTNSLAIYLAKYDRDGNYLWAFQIAGQSSGGEGRGIAISPEGDVYLTGRVSVEPDFDPGPGVYTLDASAGDQFLAKYSADGELLWAGNPTPGGSDEADAVHVDSDGNVLVAGLINGTCDMDIGAGVATLTSTGSFDATVAKYAPDGALLWAVNLGGTSGDRAYGIGTDANNDIYVTGYFNGTADFDPGPGQALHTANSPIGEYEAFLVKLSASGQWIWSKHWGAGGTDIAYDLEVSADGDVLVIGNFEYDVDVDPGPGETILDGNSTPAIFLAWFQADGSFSQAYPLTGGQAGGYGVDTDAAGNAYICGYSSGSLDLIPGPGTSFLTGSGCVLAKVALGATGLPSAVAPSGPQLSIVAGPYYALDVRTTPASRLAVVDALGRCVHTEERPEVQRSIDLEGSAPGIYFFIAEGIFGRTIEKVVRP